MVCGKIKLRPRVRRNRIDIDDEWLTVGVLVFAFDFGSNATLLGSLRSAEYTERLHRHRGKMKSSSLTANITDVAKYFMSTSNGATRLVKWLKETNFFTKICPKHSSKIYHRASQGIAPVTASKPIRIM